MWSYPANVSGMLRRPYTIVWLSALGRPCRMVICWPVSRVGSPATIVKTGSCLQRISIKRRSVLQRMVQPSRIVVYWMVFMPRLRTLLIMATVNSSAMHCSCKYEIQKRSKVNSWRVVRLIQTQARLQNNLEKYNLQRLLSFLSTCESNQSIELRNDCSLCPVLVNRNERYAIVWLETIPNG